MEGRFTVLGLRMADSLVNMASRLPVPAVVTTIAATFVGFCWMVVVGFPIATFSLTVAAATLWCIWLEHHPDCQRVVAADWAAQGISVEVVADQPTRSATLVLVGGRGGSPVESAGYSEPAIRAIPLRTESGRTAARAPANGITFVLAALLCARAASAQTVVAQPPEPSSTPATSAAAEPAGPNPGALSLTGGVEFLNRYMFRGIRQNSTGAAIWPWADLGVALYSGEGVVKSVGGDVGVWNSLHTGDTGSDGPSGKLWYEGDFYAALGLGFGHGVSVATTYTACTSPNNSFSTVKEITPKVAVDDTAPLGKAALGCTRWWPASSTRRTARGRRTPEPTAARTWNSGSRPATPVRGRACRCP